MKATFASALAGSALVAASPVAIDIGSEAHLQKRCDHWEVFPTYLANDTQDIYYSSGWTILSHKGSFDYGHTEAFSNNPRA